jgi:hypothetical protein
MLLPANRNAEQSHIKCIAVLAISFQESIAAVTATKGKYNKNGSVYKHSCLF